MRAVPWFLPPSGASRFPDPRDADADGLVAYGGDLSVRRLLDAYDHGIFPCFPDDSPPLWWSPDPRAIVTPESLHVARRLARTIRGGSFRWSWNTAFDAVVDGCAEGRPDAWILPSIKSAYRELHRLGHAFSVEVWSGETLAGGLYGVQRGAAFAAESMFHRVTDASKVALVVAVRSLFRAGIELFDVQYVTEHLASLGAFAIPRAAYLDRLDAARRRTVDLTRTNLVAIEPNPSP
ncbi:MAG: leucyl/phenylalanyl-tRNA--protein transferase [Planctomycetes bacterium]|nr:leucyl/phenylalanyl-tRNA--protein transferase [Planctomycetota bacterium]